MATHIDSLAVEAAVGNGVLDRLYGCLPSEVKPNLTADVVIANILADVIVELTPELVGLVSPRQFFIGRYN